MRKKELGCRTEWRGQGLEKDVEGRKKMERQRKESGMRWLKQ